MRLIIESSDERVIQAIIELIRPFNVSHRQVAGVETGSDLKEEKKAATTGKTNKPRPKFGSAKGKYRMAADFDAPLEIFKDYMPQVAP